MGRKRRAADPFAFGLLNGLLEAIPREMAEVLKRTSFHPIFNEVLDFSTAILDAQGQLAACSMGVTVHLGALELCVQSVISHLGPGNLRPGDILIHNDPFPGGTHLPDVDIILPIFHEGRLVAFAAARGHHGDIGGAHAGSFAGDSTSIFQEGVRIPPTKLYEAGRLNEAFLNLLLANVRVPRFTWGDLQAQVAGCRVGERRLLELCAKHGVGTVSAAMDWAMDYSERLMRARIRLIPDGTYAFSDYLDNDGVERERPLKIHVKATVAGGSVVLDFSGSDAQVKGPANCVLGVTRSSAYAAMLYLTDPDIPKNHGCYRPIRVIAPEGRLVNAAHPAPVVSGNTETASRIIDVIIGALARAVPERVTAADSGTATAHIAGGVDPRTGEPYAWYLGADPCAWGARATKDGFGCAGGPRIGGHVSQISMEVFETRFPFRVEQYALARDSGGPGRFRGGLSGITVIKPVGHECSVGGANDRCLIPPYGIFGGMPGLHGENKIIRPDGRLVPLDRAGGETAGPDDVLYFRAPGGGGYGDPLDRDLGHLQRDLDNEVVSVESAERDYGAVVDRKTRAIDYAATALRRRKLKAAWRRDRLFIDQETRPFAKKPMRRVRMGGTA